MAFINSIDIIKFRGIQKLEVSEFSNIEDFLNYDYKSGYPDKLIINI